MKKKLVILTGAGVSAESGIQTFRDIDGLWFGHKVEEVASIEGWRNDKEKVLDFYNKRREDLKLCEPNAAHKGLKNLEDYFDVTIITQNVDDLHERAGSTNIIHLHGELNKMCSSRNKSLTLPYDTDIKLGNKHADGSQLRPFIVWFGEDVPMYEVAAKVAYNADILVVIGTSLQVYPAAHLVTLPLIDIPKFILDKNSPVDEKEFINLTVIEKTAVEGIDTLKDALLKLI